MYIVGVRHARAQFNETTGWDVSLPRWSCWYQRDCRDWLADAFGNQILQRVEHQLLNMTEQPRRAMLGMGHSATFALQVLSRQPASFQDFILGSPYPQPYVGLVDALQQLSEALRAKIGISIILGERENEGVTNAANIHDEVVPHGSELAKALTQLGLEVNGPVLVDGEDHSSLKLSLVSRGLAWLTARRIHNTNSQPASLY